MYVLTFICSIHNLLFLYFITICGKLVLFLFHFFLLDMKCVREGYEIILFAHKALVTVYIYWPSFAKSRSNTSTVARYLVRVQCPRHVINSLNLPFLTLLPAVEVRLTPPHFFNVAQEPFELLTYKFVTFPEN